MAGKVSLDDYAPAADEKIMLVVGGEDKSVGQFILNAADAVVKIPQTGRISSLNASVSAAIAIHTLSRRVPTVG
jgi:tRNA G18 (ribose-2'-O)-methylase SpoU